MTTALAWQDLAACKGEDVALFYPDKSAGMTGYREARKICRACPVRHDCLTEALRRQDRYGMLGGLSPRQRARIIRNRETT